MKKELTFWIVAAFIIIVGIGGLFKINAEGKSDYFSDDAKCYEDEYISEVKEVLSEYYMSKAGITLTKISQDGTSIEYTVEIHTGRENSEEMMARIKKLAPKTPKSTLRVVFS